MSPATTKVLRERATLILSKKSSLISRIPTFREYFMPVSEITKKKISFLQFSINSDEGKIALKTNPTL